MTQATHVRARAKAPEDPITPGKSERQVVLPEIEEDDAAGPDRPGRVMEVNGMEETILKLAPMRRRSLEDPARCCDQRLVNRRVGQYRIESVLGRGSMACVYKAKHLGLHRPCAQGDGCGIGPKTTRPAQAVLGGSPGGRQPGASSCGDDPQPGQRPRVPFHRDGICTRRPDVARATRAARPARAGARPIWRGRSCWPWGPPTTRDWSIGISSRPTCS